MDPFHDGGPGRGRRWHRPGGFRQRKTPAPRFRSPSRCGPQIAERIGVAAFHDGIGLRGQLGASCDFLTLVATGCAGVPVSGSRSQSGRYAPASYSSSSNARSSIKKNAAFPQPPAGFCRPQPASVMVFAVGGEGTPPWPRSRHALQRRRRACRFSSGASRNAPFPAPPRRNNRWSGPGRATSRARRGPCGDATRAAGDGSPSKPMDEDYRSPHDQHLFEMEVAVQADFAAVGVVGQPATRGAAAGRRAAPAPWSISARSASLAGGAALAASPRRHESGAGRDRRRSNP